MNTISSPTINHKESWRDIAFDLSGRFPIARWAAPVPLRLIVGFGFMEHGFAKLSKGPDGFVSILRALHGVGQHTDRTARRISNTSGRLRDPGQFADGCALVGSYFYRAFALWVQFDQAHGRDGYWRAVWAGRL